MPRYFTRRRSSASSSIARARLLDVLEVELGERVDRVLGLVEVPRAVGVDADAALRRPSPRAPPARGRRRRRAADRLRRPSPWRCGIRRIARAPPGTDAASTAGTVAFTGIASRSGQAARSSSRSRSPRRARPRPRRRRTRGTARTPSSPPGPRTAPPRAPSMPRKRVARGRATTRAVASRSAREGRDAAASVLTAPSWPLARSEQSIWAPARPASHRPEVVRSDHTLTCA